MPEYPAEMTPDLELILGRPNFVCGPYAHLFRAAGAEIPPKAEAEQAYVLHWLIGLYLEHGEVWSEYADEKIKEARAKVSVKGDDKNG